MHERDVFDELVESGLVPVQEPGSHGLWSETPFRKVISARFTMQGLEQTPYDAPISKLLEDYSVKDLAAIEDQRALDGLVQGSADNLLPPALTAILKTIL